MKRTKKQLRVFVTVQCVQCHTRRDIKPGDIEPGDVPWCNRCMMPMVAIKAETRA